MNFGEQVIQAKKWVIDKLKEGLSLLSDQDIIPVESPMSLENYKLSHPIGAVLVVYAGSTFSNRDAVNKVIADRLLEFGILVIIRDVPGKLKPEYYLQYCIDFLAGLKYGNEIIYFTEDRFEEESGGVWSYYARLIVPVQFISRD
jgi:hypothetical protein